MHAQTPCDFCGQLFAPSVDNFVQSGLCALVQPTDPAEAWKGTPLPVKVEADLTAEQLHQVKENLGINDEQLKQLLSTGMIETGCLCVCDRCLDRRGQNDERLGSGDGEH